MKTPLASSLFSVRRVVGGRLVLALDVEMAEILHDLFCPFQVGVVLNNEQIANINKMR